MAGYAFRLRSLSHSGRVGSNPRRGVSGRSAVELARDGQDGEHGLGRFQHRMEMSAFQPYDRPSPPSRFQGGVIINGRALNEPSWNLVPAGQLDRIVEPIDRQPWQSALELWECDAVPRQEVRTNRGGARN